MEILADTHAIIWLLAEPSQLSPAAARELRGAIDAQRPIHISAISPIEMLYLVEKGRINSSILTDFLDLLQKLESPFRILSVDMTVYHAMPGVSRSTVPDLPDRIIAATAVAHGLMVITRDPKILESGIPAIKA